MKIRLTFVLFFTCLVLQVMGKVSSKGVAFEKEGTLFRQAVQKALSSGKLIFLDCYTSWCGPCKMMANTVFPQEEVGNFMNPKYVCIKIDMERAKDRNWPRNCKSRPILRLSYSIVADRRLDVSWADAKRKSLWKK